MDLKGDDKPVRRDAERLGHAAAILGYGLGPVAGADAAVQRVVNPLRGAALPREEGVTDGREIEIGGVQGRRDHIKTPG